MKRILILGKIFTFFYLCSLAQNTESKISDSLEIKLPDTWLGVWKGNLLIHSINGKKQEVRMELHIKRINKQRWTWAIVYGEGEQKQTRAYELFARNSQKGHYAVDEKNSIILDDYFINGALYSRFEVEKNLLLSVYRLDGENLIFEIISGKTNKPTKSGGGDKDTPEVLSYPISVVQYAKLNKAQE